MPRMKGGAVKEERSPLKEAIDCQAHQINRVRCNERAEGPTLRNEDQEPLFWGAMPAPSSLEEPDMACGKERERSL